ncbi:MAG: FkbM family methyltransferase [Puniceicoccales bacterium]|nr:FkbM family methyltransferase [Puniceicoccales bacterium]
MKIFEKSKLPFGERIYQLFGRKILTRRRVAVRMQTLMEAVADPRGVGMMNLLMAILGVPKKHRHLFYEMGEGDVCIDCGANVGVFTDLALNTGASVHLFEPNGMLIHILRRKYRDNKNVVVNHAAVAAEAGELTLYNAVDSRNEIGQTQGGSVVSDYFARENDAAAEIHCERVSVVDLATYIKSNFSCGDTPDGSPCIQPPVYLLKIDIEGAGFDLLEKMISEKVFKLCKHIVVETHERMFPDGEKKLARINAMISEHGADNISLDWM